MNVLVACEESQEVCKAFRARGHNAFSCDIQMCSGGHPEWHIKGDVLKILNPLHFIRNEKELCGIWFHTADREFHFIDGNWDLIIAHPPCTDLAVSGARWFKEKQADGRQQKSIDFFMEFANADCSRIAVENPICIMSRIWRKPDQIINPYQFGHPEMKKTCLWLKGLPKLQETNNVYEEMMKMPVKDRQKIWYMSPGKGRAKARSKTFPGIAAAMADQWG